MAERSGVLDRFGSTPPWRRPRWDDAASVWRIRTSRGELTADVLVPAAGALSEPELPDIDGIDSFAGEVFHSARWDHDHDLTGKRVAVIGTGASAIQIVPQLAEQVAHLDVYQRTAPYVIPRRDRAYTPRRAAGVHAPPGRAEGLPDGHLLGAGDVRARASSWTRGSRCRPSRPP